MRLLPLLAILAALGMLGASFFGLAPLARSAAQCPTAAVQRMAVRDCCGRIVFRAPRPGDRSFVQCRCAERKGAVVKATVTTKVVLFIEKDEPLRLSTGHPLPSSHPAFAARLVATSFPPLTHPPASA